MTVMYSTELSSVCLLCAETLGTDQLNGRGQEVES